MRSIKDFYHNINDILLAVVIVVIAASLIAWRFNVIMDYPDTIEQTENPVSAQEMNNLDDEFKAEDGDDAEAAPDEADAKADKASSKNSMDSKNTNDTKESKGSKDTKKAKQDN